VKAKRPRNENLRFFPSGTDVGLLSLSADYRRGWRLHRLDSQPMSFRDEKRRAETAQQQLARRIAATPKKELESARAVIQRLIDRRKNYEQRNGTNQSGGRGNTDRE
jgi:hypothetical protein